MKVVNYAVEDDGARARQDSLEPRDVVQLEAKDMQPIGDAVVRQFAQCRDLMNGWRPCGGTQLKVEVGRKMIGADVRVALPGAGGDSIQCEVACREDRADPIDECSRIGCPRRRLVRG
jgi:hypothetical protein